MGVPVVLPADKETGAKKEYLVVNKLGLLHKKYYSYFLAAIIISFVILSIPELTRPIDFSWEEEHITYAIENCNEYGVPHQRAAFKFYQFCASEMLFGNHKIISFAEAVGIIILVYLITVHYTKKQYTGIIASLLIVGTHTFLDNAPTGYNSTEWVFFLLLSLFAAYKKPALTGVFFTITLFAKAITLFYLPFVIWIILKSDESKRNKKIAIASLVPVVLFALFWTLFVGEHIVQFGVPIMFNVESLDIILYNPVYNFTSETFDHAYLFGFIPLSLIGLYLMKKQWRPAIPMLSMISFMFTMQIWLPLFSGYGMGNYRNVAMMTFVAISLGVLSNHKSKGVIDFVNKGKNKVKLFKVAYITAFVPVIGYLIYYLIIGNWA